MKLKFSLLLTLVIFVKEFRAQTPIKCIGKDCISPTCLSIDLTESRKISIDFFDFNLHELTLQKSISSEIEYLKNHAFLKEKIDSTFEGTVFDCYDNGKTKFLAKIGLGKKVLSLNVFYENGFMFFSETLSNDELNGTRTSYFQNSQIKTQFVYSANKRNGLCYWYYENGQLERVLNYVNGKLDGEFIEYQKNGNIGYKCEYDNGIAVGIGVRYDENEEIFDEDIFIKGTDEFCTKRFMYKLPVYEGCFINGKENGVWKYYYLRTGMLYKTTSYKMGLENGNRTEYFENGQIKREIDFVNNLQVGKYMEYYDNGKLKVKGNYHSRIVDGTPIEELHGNYSEYDRNGKLIFSTTYNNGVDVNLK